jgi:hypothetical protein
VKKSSEKQRIKKNQKPSAFNVDDIPKGINDFLGPDHLHLFKIDRAGTVLSQGRL